MKKWPISIVFAFLFTHFAGAQSSQKGEAQSDREFDSSSKISFTALSHDLINNLELLGRVWGFLKYNHPAVAAGNYNWDGELFRILPAYINVKNKVERDSVLVTWIGKYGEVPVCKKCRPAPGDAVLKPSLQWMEETGVSTDLTLLLKNIYNNRNRGKNYYIALQPNVRNPDFSREKPYTNLSYPDDGFRLLALYRYWSMIQYFYPNRHLTVKNWDAVLREYIPKFIKAKNRLEYELAALQLIGEVNDSHANLWGGGNKIAELRGTNFAPVRVEFMDNKAVVTGYYNSELADAAKLKIGDVITHINGKTVQSIVDSLQPFYPASNEASRLRDISVDLLRSSGKTINLKYISENKTDETEVPLFDRSKLNMYYWFKVANNEKCFKMLEGNIGYITLANIKSEDIPAIKQQFQKTKGIIIDIRNYPSTFVPFLLGSYFVTNRAPFVKFTNANINNPGEFTFTAPLEIRGSKDHYGGKLVVLVNENSQSQAEYTAMAFRAGDNTTIVGSTTAGADGNVSTIWLPGGLRTMISGIGVYYPDGKQTQRIGIVPDVYIKPTIEGIKKGRDEVLEKAIEIINR